MTMPTQAKAVWLWIGGLMAALTLGVVVSSGLGTGAWVQAQRHYRALLPAPAVSPLQVVQTAQRLGYWIRVQTGLDVLYLKGQTPCSACDPAQEAAFFEPPRLSVDGPWFWLNLDEPGWALHLRPSPQPDAYELIVSPKLPKTVLDEEDVKAVHEALAPFGVLPPDLTPDELGRALAPYVPPAKPAPPEGARLDSGLYGLVLAPDWAQYAQERGIERSGLRVRVLVELTNPDAQLPEALAVEVEARSGALVRAQALIHRLIELARHPSVAFVRLPARPHPATP